jgi:hypothetical protein
MPRVGDRYEARSSGRPRGETREGTVLKILRDGRAEVYWQPPYRTTVCSAETLAKYRLVKEGPER